MGLCITGPLHPLLAIILVAAGVEEFHMLKHSI